MFDAEPAAVHGSRKSAHQRARYKSDAAFARPRSGRGKVQIGGAGGRRLAALRGNPRFERLTALPGLGSRLLSAFPPEVLVSRVPFDVAVERVRAKLFADKGASQPLMAESKQ